MTIDAAVRYRKFDATYLKYVQGEDFRGNDLPVTTLAADRVQLPVGRSGAPAQSAASLCLERLELALSWWRGEYLADAIHEEWAQLGVDRMRARFVKASVRAAELLGAAGRIDDAIEHATAALQYEPWSEPAFRAAAAAHLAGGSREAARRVLARCADRLDELGVRPDDDTLVLMRTVGGFPV